MSSWSSSDELCTGACRPSGSSPWCGRPPGVFRYRLGRPRLLRRARRRPRLHRARAAAAEPGPCAAAAGWRFAAVHAPPPRAGRHRGRPKRGAGAGPCAASPECSAAGRSPRMTRSSFCAGTGSSSIRGIRGARFAGRSGAGGMKARRRRRLRPPWARPPAPGTATASAASAGSSRPPSVIGSTAAATAALAAFSIASAARGASAGAAWPAARPLGAFDALAPAAAGRRAASG